MQGLQGLLDINVVVVESVAAVQPSSSAKWSSLNVTGCVVQLFFDYAPETAAHVLPERMFKPALGALLPETLIAATPSLYGFIGVHAWRVTSAELDSTHKVGCEMCSCTMPVVPVQNAAIFQASTC